MITSQANYEGLSADGVIISVKKGKTTLYIADLLSFSTDVPGCSVFSVEGYTAADYLTLTSTSSLTRLIANPTKRADDGTWNPYIEFEYLETSATAENIYLRF